MNGSASYTGSGCYQLTPNTAQQTGATWFPNKISLNESFVISGRFNFGNKTVGGADGIAFALQPVSTNSTGSGAGMGIGGITPSFIAEFDTWRNSGEPTYDHLVIQKNGDFNHTTPNKLAGPVQIHATTPNVKTGVWYPVRFIWNATTKTFTVEVNCVTRLTYTGDIVNTIFGGDPNVYWGFSSATGNNFSQHQVCLDATDLIEIPGKSICQGDTIGIELPVVGKNYSIASWVPTTGIVNAAQPRPVFQPTVTTNYQVTYQDYCNNSIKDTFNITVAPATPIGLPDSIEICNGTPSILSAPNTFSSYLWSTGATSNQISVNLAGKYILSAKNANNCTSKDSTIVVNSAGLSVKLGNDTSICSGNNLTLNAGNSGSTYLWNTGATTQTITINSIGQYFVTVTSPSGCIGKDTIVVALKNPLIVNLGNDTSICSGTNLNLNALNVGASYLWNTGATAQSININSTGKYWISVSKVGFCATTDTINISNSNGQIVNLGKDTSICNAANLSLNAGIIGATYLWSTGENTQTINVNTAGQYFVTVSGLNLCKNKDTINVSVTNGLNIQLGQDTSICSPINLSLNAGVTGATYLWNTGATSQTINVNAPGQYFVSVTNSSACNGKDTIIVSLSNNLKVNLGADKSICPGQNLNLDAGITGGTYLWNTGETSKTININNSGVYHVSVTSNGCSGQDTVLVHLQCCDAVSFLNDTLAICTGDSVIITANGTILKSEWISTAPFDSIAPDQIKAKPIVDSKYVIKTTKKGNNVISNGDFEAGKTGFTSDYTESCVTGSMPWGAYCIGNNTGSYWPTWSNCGDHTSGTGKMYITDASSVDNSKIWCQNISTVSNTNYEFSAFATSLINENPPILQFSINGVLMSTPFGLNGTPCLWQEFTTQWNSGTTTSAQLCVTNQNTTASGNDFALDDISFAPICIEYDTITVLVASSALVNIGKDTSICANSSLTLDAGVNGANYLWSTGETSKTISVNKSGQYTLELSFGATCKGFDTINVIVNNPLNLTLGPDQSICSGNTVSLDAQVLGATYLWNTGETSKTIVASNAGTYFVTVTDANNCSKKDTIVVNLSTPPVVNLGSDFAICNATNYVLDAGNSGSTFTWNTSASSQKITINGPGTYSVIVNNPQNCAAKDTIIVSDGGTILLNLGNDTLICQGASFSLNAGNPGSSYLWSNGSRASSITANSTGLYWVEVTNSTGCSVRDSINVGQDNSNFTLPDQYTKCEGQNVTLTPSLNGAWQFLWDNTTMSTNLTTNVAGWHYLMGNSHIGCVIVDSTFVTDVLYPNITFSKDTSACEGEVLELSIVTDGSKILWDNGTTFPYIAVNKTGRYEVKVSNTLNGKTCSTSATQQIKFFEIPEIVEAKNQVVCFEFLKTQHILTSTKANYYAWEGEAGITNAFYPIHSEGIYHVKIYNDTLCTVEQEIIVEEKCPLRFFIPNAFTPDADGKNEFFKPVVSNAIAYEFYIFNRWGEQIYYGVDSSKGWDGTINGHDVQIDVYIWKANITGYDENNKSKSIQKTGTVTLIR